MYTRGERKRGHTVYEGSDSRSRGPRPYVGSAPSTPSALYPSVSLVREPPLTHSLSCRCRPAAINITLFERILLLVKAQERFFKTKHQTQFNLALNFILKLVSHIPKIYIHTYILKQNNFYVFRKVFLTFCLLVFSYFLLVSVLYGNF